MDFSDKFEKCIDKDRSILYNILSSVREGV